MNYPKFYSEDQSANKELVASVQAKILIALMTISHGTATSTFGDYFQMSDMLANKCHNKFTEGMVACFNADYMHVMTPEDAKSVVQLHCMVHGVDGLAGALDCMYYDWLKCPKAWQGVYKRGDQKYPLLVLEAMCDYNLCGSGMHSLVYQALSMTLAFFSCCLSLMHSLMEASKI